MKNETKEIRYIDLFGGVGGFILGIERASGNWKNESYRKDSEQERNISNTSLPKDKQCSTHCVFYNDIDKYAVQTYNKNFKENYEATDIRTIAADSIPDFDMLCGGYPCQSFSIAGKRKGFDDTRGNLFFEIARIAREKQPKIIFLENVKGLLSHDKGNTFKTITQHLNSMGYLVDYRILNSKYFGVPQNRERVFHIGYNLKWMIKESVEDGQIKRNSQLDKMLKGWILENLLKDLEEVRKLPELKLKGWVLNYLKYICGNKTRLEYSKTIKNLQINKSQNSLKEPHLQLPRKEENLDPISKEKKKNLKMVQDIYESMMEKEIDFMFIELWQKSILEKLEKSNQFITSTLIKKIIEKKTFSCAEINLIMGLLIIQDSLYLENWLNQELSDLIKLKEFIKNEGRRNKTKLRERYLLRNIRTSLGFTESPNKQRNFIIGSLRGTSRPEILPFGEDDREIDELQGQQTNTITAKYEKAQATGSYLIKSKQYAQKESSQGMRVYDTEGCSSTIAGNAGGLGGKTGLYKIPETHPTIRAEHHNTSNVHVIPVLTPNRENKRQNGRRFKEDGEPSFTLTGQDVHGVSDGMKIRRLTPIECLRLQGFPDDWFPEEISDTQRYKQMGNAVTVNVIQAIAEKLIPLLKQTKL